MRFPAPLFIEQQGNNSSVFALLTARDQAEKHPEIHNTLWAIPPKRNAHGMFNGNRHHVTGLIAQYRGSNHRIPGTDRGVTILADNLQQITLGVGDKHFPL